MDTSKIKKTYYIKKDIVKGMETLSEGNITKVVNELLGFALYCTTMSLANGVDLNDIESVFEEGLDVYIKNRRDNS